MDSWTTTDTLTPVETIRNADYGITMKMIDLPNRNIISGFLGEDDSSSTNDNLNKAKQGLLSTDIGPDGYPITARDPEDAHPVSGYTYQKGRSLGDLIGDSTVVDGLFIKSTYEATGYFEFDSCQNTATLVQYNGGNEITGNQFTVYKELSTDNNTFNNKW